MKRTLLLSAFFFFFAVSLAQKQNILIFGIPQINVKIDLSTLLFEKDLMYEFLYADFKGKKVDGALDKMREKVAESSDKAAAGNTSLQEESVFPAMLGVKIPIGKLLPSLNRPEAVMYRRYEISSTKDIDTEIKEGLSIIHRWLDDDFGNYGKYSDVLTLLKKNGVLDANNGSIPYEYQVALVDKRKMLPPQQGSYQPKK